MPPKYYNMASMLFLVPLLLLIPPSDGAKSASPGSDLMYAEAQSLRALADGGDANAQWMMGQGYLSPPDADPAAAFQWFLRAADQGHGLAQRDLGFLYEAGWGVEQSLQEAYFWYSLAALHDSGRAAVRRDSLATGLSLEQRDSAERRVRSWRPLKESR